jgi:hypothetical protein
MAVLAFRRKPSRLIRRSSAASLFNGSDAFGSRNKNCLAVSYCPDGPGQTMTNLHSHDDGVEIQHRLPIFPQDVQADISLQIDVGMVDLLRAFDLGWIVRKVLVNDEREDKASPLVHSLVGFDGQGEIEDIVTVGEIDAHGRPEG